jgi:hypothetical protein
MHTEGLAPGSIALQLSTALLTQNSLECACGSQLSTTEMYMKGYAKGEAMRAAATTQTPTPS